VYGCRQVLALSPLRHCAKHHRQHHHHHRHHQLQQQQHQQLDKRVVLVARYFKKVNGAERNIHIDRRCGKTVGRH